MKTEALPGAQARPGSPASLRAVQNCKPAITYCHSPIDIELEDEEMPQVNEESEQKPKQAAQLPSSKVPQAPPKKSTTAFVSALAFNSG